MADIFNYSRYIDLLRTTKDIREHFPIEQLTVNFDINGAVSDGWSTKISWITLIVDQMSYLPGRIPDFTQSEIIGYFPYGEKEEIAEGILQLPAQMYQGPIIPDRLFSVPITLVSFQFTRGSEIWSKQLLLIENWCPGVTIGEPTLDNNYSEVIGATSTLTLGSDPDYVVQGDNFTLTASSDIPIALELTDHARFYRIREGYSPLFIGSATFVNHVANLTVDSLSYDLGSYTFYANFVGRTPYGYVRSNDFTLDVIEGFPLDVNVSLSPNPITKGQILTGISSALIRSGYPQTSTNHILNSIHVSVDTTASTSGLINPLYSKNGNFVQGQDTSSFTITNSFIPTVLTGTTYSISTGTITGSNYQYTANVSKDLIYTISWDDYTPSKISNGSTSSVFSVTTIGNYSTALKPISLTILDKNTGNPANNIWSNHQVNLRAQVDVGHPLLATTTDVTFFAQYSEDTSIQSYTIPNKPPDSGYFVTSKSKIIGAIGNNQYILDYIPANVKVGAALSIHTGTTITSINSNKLTITISPTRSDLLNDINQEITFINSTVTSTTVLIGTATVLTSSGNQYLWRLNDQTLNPGNYNFTSTLVNHIILGDQAPTLYPGNSTGSHELTVINGLNPKLTFRVDQTNSSTDRVILTSSYGNSENPDHFYSFNDSVQFLLNGNLAAQAPWSLTTGSFTQSAEYSFPRGYINDGIIASWQGNTNRTKVYEDEILFLPQSLGLPYSNTTSNTLSLNTTTIYSTGTLLLTSNISSNVTYGLTTSSSITGYMDYIYSTGYVNTSAQYVALSTTSTFTSTWINSASSVLSINPQNLSLDLRYTNWLQIKTSYSGDLNNQSSTSSSSIVKISLPTSYNSTSTGGVLGTSSTVALLTLNETNYRPVTARYNIVVDAYVVYERYLPFPETYLTWDDSWDLTASKTQFCHIFRRTDTNNPPGSPWYHKVEGPYLEPGPNPIIWGQIPIDSQDSRYPYVIRRLTIPSGYLSWYNIFGSSSYPNVISSLELYLRVRYPAGYPTVKVTVIPIDIRIYVS